VAAPGALESGLSPPNQGDADVAAPGAARSGSASRRGLQRGRHLGQERAGMEPVTVIGAGLAGSECAVQLARRGIPVRCAR
jgi:NADPH-dependent 2,4-dienoyl-CoA reductase/sulfur reductase-like enzyme